MYINITLEAQTSKMYIFINPTAKKTEKLHPVFIKNLGNLTTSLLSLTATRIR